MTDYLQAYYPPSVDMTNRYLAYGRNAVPSLVDKLTNADLPDRQKAIISLTELFHKPENISQGIKANVFRALDKSLVEEDTLMRQKATEIYYILSGHSIGKRNVEDSLDTLSFLFDDVDNLVRMNLHVTLQRLSTSTSGVKEICGLGLVAKLVQKLTVELLEIKVVILDTLYNCIRNDAHHALKHGSMAVFKDIITDIAAPTELKVAAATDIMMLCFSTQGKAEACEQDAITPLLDLLYDHEPTVRGAAAGALMSISISIEGKKAIIKKGILPLSSALHDDSNGVKLNAIQTICNIAEDHRGQLLLKQSGLDVLKLLTTGQEDKQIMIAAQRAVDKITWMP